MKKLIFWMVFLLLFSNVIAQNEAQEISEDVGIAPDSRLYGLENAFKKISLALTFNKEAKARKELDISKERLREVKLMIERNKPEAAQKAEERHREIIEKLRERLEIDANEDEVETQVEIETEINDQETEIEDIKTRVEVKGQLTLEQRELLNRLIENLRENNRDLKVRIDAREDKLKIRLEQSGLNKEEVRVKFEERKDDGLERALKERIENAKKQIEISKERFGDNQDLVLAKQRLEEAEDLIEQGKLEEAKNLILEALKLGVLVRKEITPEVRERVKEEIRNVKVERVEDLLEKRRIEVKEEIEDVKDTEDDSDEEDDGPSEIKRNSGDDSGY